MIIIGDIHGKYHEYISLLKSFKGEASVQIGDFGFGFGKPPGRGRPPSLPTTARFFPGNHDCRELCHESEHCLGDYGVRKIDGIEFFFVSGAWSIDQYRRTEGVSWWRDEELSLAELNDAYDLYVTVKPDIVLSHDGPRVAIDRMMQKVYTHKPWMPTRTDQALSAMYEAHQPKQWFFGHWHQDWCEQIGNTVFRCLPELGWARIESEQIEEAA